MRFSPDLQTRVLNSPLGPLTLAASPLGLVGAWFEGDVHRPDTRAWPQAHHHALLQEAQQQLLAYLAGRTVPFDLPLDLRSGTDFQQTVWRTLLTLPYGTHSTYGRLGAQMGKPLAARAVGAAVARNPLIIIVPCHRVLGADGTLTGFAAGLSRKRALLQLERIRFRE